MSEPKKIRLKEDLVEPLQEQVAALQADNDKLEMEASEYLMRIKELEAKVRVVDKMVAALGITYAELNDAIPEQLKGEG